MAIATLLPAWWNDRAKRGVRMGITVLAIEVANLANPDVTERLDFLVDSGAVYSVVPATVLGRLNISPLREEEFLLADGTRMRRRIGGALFKYAGLTGVANVIFGEEGDSVLLGATSLEALGFVLDPIRRDLRRLPMILGAAAAAR